MTSAILSTFHAHSAALLLFYHAARPGQSPCADTHRTQGANLAKWLRIPRLPFDGTGSVAWLPGQEAGRVDYFTASKMRPETLMLGSGCSTSTTLMI
jgi:hypothetical protein